MNQDQARRCAETVELPKPTREMMEVHQPAEHNEWVVTSARYTESQVREAIASALVKLTQGKEPNFDAVWSNFGATEFEDLHQRLSIHDVRRMFAMFVQHAYPAPSQQEDRKQWAERVAELERVLGVARDALSDIDDRFSPVRSDFIFSKRMALDKCKSAIAAIDAARSKEGG